MPQAVGEAKVLGPRAAEEALFGPPIHTASAVSSSGATQASSSAHGDTTSAVVVEMGLPGVDQVLPSGDLRYSNAISKLAWFPT